VPVYPGPRRLRRELTACLRTGRALRVPRARTRGRGKKFVTPEVMISERPAEAADRAVPGHWEGDLIVGLNSSATGTLAGRTTRYTMLLHLPPMEGHQTSPRVKNGPALAGHGAEAVRDAIASTITTLPGQLRRSLTWDQGAEMAGHAQLRTGTGVEIYFCDPHSPWQRGTNENTNALLRQYFPKGTDLSRHSPDDLAAAPEATEGITGAFIRTVITLATGNHDAARRLAELIAEHGNRSQREACAIRLRAFAIQPNPSPALDVAELIAPGTRQT
jgi:IS30 family transposase